MLSGAGGVGGVQAPSNAALAIAVIAQPIEIPLAILCPKILSPD
jgi:hypothetical protein